MSKKTDKKEPIVTLFSRVTEARAVLGLADEATMETIKNAFREKILVWHPDKCKEPLEECQHKAARLIEAYKLISDYCAHYKFSFRQKDVEAHAPYEEIWYKLYGQDPLWGN
jgi:preprotein translocase subunit Sec63